MELIAIVEAESLIGSLKSVDIYVVIKVSTHVKWHKTFRKVLSSHASDHIPTSN